LQHAWKYDCDKKEADYEAYTWYAPLKLVVYEDKEGRTFVAFDSFTSLLVQYQHEEITQVAHVV
jgi:uncharacterized protein (DUF302 family)